MSKLDLMKTAERLEAAGWAFVALLVAGGCARDRGEPAREAVEMNLRVRSMAFDSGSRIPKRHTGDGEDLSPALSWEGVPPGTASLALLCDDPDAPGKAWVHWVLYDLPAATRSLTEGVFDRETLPDGSKQGRNDFGKIGYGGPSPPRGHGDHHYHFKVYALDRPLGLPPGATKAQVDKAMAGRILAEGELVGIYSR